jgi:hypothetical protein
MGRLKVKKAVLVISLVLAGYIGGVVMSELLSRSARRAHREMLQGLFISTEYKRADIALKEKDDLQAMVHLWNLVEAQRLDNPRFFNDPVATGLDNVTYAILRQTNDLLRKTTPIKRGQEQLPLGVAHGDLAAILDRLGYKDPANTHYRIASQLLNMTEDKVREFFRGAIEKRRAGISLSENTGRVREDVPEGTQK